MVDLPIHIICSKRESGVRPICAFFSEENAKLQINEWDKISNDVYDTLKLELRLTTEELQDLIQKVTEANNIDDYFYLKRINALNPEVVYILNRVGEFVIPSEENLDSLLGFETAMSMQTYILNNPKHKELLSEILFGSMSKTKSSEYDYSIEEFLAKEAYEVGFVADTCLYSIEKLDSNALKEKMSKYLVDEKEKQKENVKQLLNRKIALQNEVEELKLKLANKES